MAIQYTATRTKNVHEFQLNLDKVMEMEDADPEFTPVSYTHLTLPTKA